MLKRLVPSVIVVTIGLALASCTNSPSSISASSSATNSEGFITNSGDFIPDPTSKAYIFGRQSGEVLMSINPDKPYAKSYFENTAFPNGDGGLTATITCQNILKTTNLSGDVEKELNFKAGCTTALGWSLKWVKP